MKIIVVADASWTYKTNSIGLYLNISWINETYFLHRYKFETNSSLKWELNCYWLNTIMFLFSWSAILGFGNMHPALLQIGLEYRLWA